MSRESTRRQFLAAGGAAGAVALAGCGGGGVGGGGGGTTDWYFGETNKQLSKELVSILNTKDAREIKLRKGVTAATALTRLNNGTGEFAIAGADAALFAKKGAGMNEVSKKHTKLRAVMALYPMPVTVVARPGLEAERLSDLSGATVNVGKTNGRLASNANQILTQSGADFSLRNVGLSKAMTQLTEGSLDVTFAIGDWPITSIADAMPDLKILKLSGGVRSTVVQSTEWLVKAKLPAGIYDGIDHMVETVGIPALLLAGQGASKKNVAIVTDRMLRSSANGNIKTRGSYINGKSKKEFRRGIPKQIDLHEGAQQVLVFR